MVSYMLMGGVKKHRGCLKAEGCPKADWQRKFRSIMER